MTKQISDHAAAAKMIRAELKRHAIKGSVRSESYAGGSAVRVEIQQDVLPATRAAIEAFANQFQFGNFDGSTDSYDYSNTRDDIPQVKFVFVSVNYSDDIKAEARAFLGDTEDRSYDADQRVRLTLVSSYCPEFWTARKARKTAELVAA